MTTNSIFEKIRHIDEVGNEYWYARELMVVLEYKKWQNFKTVINNAKISCINSNISLSEQFTEVSKPLVGGNGNIQNVLDYKLSRYACYLITQNADPRKEVVALGQTYFAIQTRKQELLEDELKNLSEDDKRIKIRKQVRNGNYGLNRTAINSGVKNLGEFHNAGYKGLYNGETANDIAKRKELNYRQDILDFMGSEELADNLFRIIQTDSKLKRDKVDNEYEANLTHFEVAKEVRESIKKIKGTMPEDLPTPKSSIKDIDNKKIE
ncbi:MAG: DNA damage-inducible protein D [Bacilli bacterium]|nr:DNA damage-inducible protein D [Bacilli bacterium]